MERSYFNSYVSREDYAVIKDEAFRTGITVKQHISNIISNYAKLKRKEDSDQNEVNDDDSDNG